MAAPTAITQELLSRAHNPDNVKRIYTEKIKHHPIFLRQSSPPPGANARETRRRARDQAAKERNKKLRPKPLPARQRRKLGLYDVPRESQRYAVFEPLHRLWLGYVREVLGGDIRAGGQAAAAKLSSADFHGAKVEVVRSKCPSRVGIHGIVIKDSKFVFEVITKGNKVKTVPKEGTLFRVEIPVESEKIKESGTAEGAAQDDVPKMVVELHGDQFQIRSVDRSTKKFKEHFLEDL